MPATNLFELDEDHYTGGVMERVLARIRESRFVVAEFADNRGRCLL